MPYENSNYKVIFGYYDENGKFIEVPFENLEFVEDVFEDEEDTNPYTSLAEQYYLIYSAFIDAGFEKNHAFSFTRDVLREIKEITNAEKN